MNPADPQPSQDFTAHERLLWRVLAVLARDGFPVPPDEARDVIHDFYLDAWPGLRERYDPTKASFATYLAGAFYRFARRRIVRLHDLRRSLVDISLQAEEADAAPGPEALVHDRRALARLHEVLQAIPPVDRQLLIDFAASPLDGERVHARRHDITRHALRRRLLDTLGRVAADMSSSQLPTGPDVPSGLSVRRGPTHTASDLIAAIRALDAPTRTRVQKNATHPAGRPGRDAELPR